MMGSQFVVPRGSMGVACAAFRYILFTNSFQHSEDLDVRMFRVQSAALS